MCDETTDAAAAEALRRLGLTRREFAVTGAAAALAAYAGPAGAAARLREAAVEVQTADGSCDAFFVHPARGRHPGVVLWPDAYGLRDAKKAMARRLAAEGYAVLAVNPYYRGSRAPLALAPGPWTDPARRAVMGPLIAALTPEAVTRDGAAHVAFLDGQAAVDKRRGIGVQGYCMGGPPPRRRAG